MTQVVTSPSPPSDSSMSTPPISTGGEHNGQDISRHTVEPVQEEPEPAEGEQSHSSTTSSASTSSSTLAGPGPQRTSSVYRPSPLRRQDSASSRSSAEGSAGSSSSSSRKQEFDASKSGSVPAAMRNSTSSDRSSGSGGDGRQLARTPSASKVPDVPSSIAGPRQKPSLMKRLSGINLFHHHHHNNSKDSNKSSKHDQHAALQQTQVDRHNYELTHPRTGEKSGPSQKLQQTTTTTNKPSFSIGSTESRDNTPIGSPNHSGMPSRQPSNDNISSSGSNAGSGIRQAHEEAMAAGDGDNVAHSSHLISSTATSNKSSTGGLAQAPAPVPPTPDEDFRPGRLRSSSTFSLFKKKDHNPTEPMTIKRPASFAHEYGSGPIPGGSVASSTGGFGETPMSELSRTLSRNSLIKGDGWGHITGQLPKFDSIYQYVEADSKFLKMNKKLKGQIGEGAGGVVRTARLRGERHPVYSSASTGGDLGLFAVKTFAKRRDNENEGFYCAKLVREFRVHSALTHDNIVRLADICVEDRKFGDNSFVAVMDFCIAGDLFDIHWHPYNAIDQGVMGKTEKYCCYKQLMFAVNYMHSQGIAHRDIKLENILVNGHGQIKLADFGTSVFTQGPDREDCRGIVGTDHSIPPEAYLSGSKRGPAYDGLKADIWACACVFHFLTFDNDSPMAALHAYPFGEAGAAPENKLWQKFMNNLKRFEPEKYIPGAGGNDHSRKVSSAASSVSGSGNGFHASPPQSPVIKSPQRQGSIASHMSLHHASAGNSLEAGLLGDDWQDDDSTRSPTVASSNIDDNFDPMRKRNPFCRLPASSFTSMKGMLDPNPETRWTARQVLDDHFFGLIDCCQADSNPDGFKPPPMKPKRANTISSHNGGTTDKQSVAQQVHGGAAQGLHKVHNHVRPVHRKLMESNAVEQARNDETVKEMRRNHQAEDAACHC
ncbi:hypothetical protein PYCC9005_000504 [Savitreella phatthalungensis]